MTELTMRGRGRARRGAPVRRTARTGIVVAVPAAAAALAGGPGCLFGQDGSGGTGAELSVPAPVVAVRTEAGQSVGWEVHVANGGAEPFTIDGVEVLADGAVVQDLEGDALKERLMVVSPAMRPAGNEGPVEPGGYGILFLWSDGPAAPATLSHTLHLVGAEGAESAVSGAEATVDRSGAVVLEPPLRGGGWLAANGPANASNHRRALIAAGGRPTIAQRFAIDFVQLEGESTFDGDREDNAAYHAYGHPALAVADAVVASTHDGIPENVPGPTSRAVEITLETVAGNYVILDLGDGRYAFYAHLQPGSLRVAEGDRVTAGQVLGLVGNSGNSTEPHLHFHVGDANSPLGAEGLPYTFDRYLLQGRANLGGGGGWEAEGGDERSATLPTLNEVVSFPEEGR